MPSAQTAGEKTAAPGRPGLLGAAFQTYATQIATAGLSLANVLIVARALGADGRGQVAFVTAVAFLTSNLLTAGVQEANVNLAGSEPETRRALATNSLILALLLGLVGLGAVALLVAIVPAVAGDATILMLGLALGFLPMHILSIYLRFLVQGDYGFGVTNLAWLLPAVINLGVNGVLFLMDRLTVVAAISTWIGGQIVATALLAWHVSRRGVGFGRPSLVLARRTLAFGVKSHVGRIMLLANYRLDQWILGAIAGSRELGLYSVAVAWAEALFLLPTALSAVQRPNLVRASDRESASLAAGVLRVALLVTAFMSIVMVVAAPFLCVSIFGPEFRGSIDDLRVLTAGAFGIVALKQLGSALTARGRPGLASAAISTSFVSIVALDALLIAPYGGLGAALASTISYSLGGVVVATVFVRTLGGHVGELLPRAGDARDLRAHVRALRARPRDKEGSPAGERAGP